MELYQVACLVVIAIVLILVVAEFLRNQQTVCLEVYILRRSVALLALCVTCLGIKAIDDNHLKQSLTHRVELAELSILELKAK